MKVDIAFSTQVQGSDECVVNAMLMYALRKDTYGVDQTSWCGAESD